MRLRTSRSQLEDPMHRNPSYRLGALSLLIILALLASACGGGTPSSAPASESTAASASASASASAEESGGPTGPANIEGPESVEAGSSFDLTWTGPDAQGDYITIVEAGAEQWAGEPYFDTGNTDGSGTLTAPTKAGSYVLWYVSGADDAILVRVAITVTPFTGDLLAEDEVMAGTIFDVSWNGPDGPGDFITIVEVGATQWTNEDWFYTGEGPTGNLQAPLKEGAYEIWYVAGSDRTIFARRPITLTPYEITLQAPEQVAAGDEIVIEWTGPNGQSDYLTIVPVGAGPAEYGEYRYTTEGSPITLTAPSTPGDYEIRYNTDRNDTVMARFTIRVT
jgi:Ca-activated chloride channel family protein